MISAHHTPPTTVFARVAPPSAAQQPPTDHESVNGIDVTAELEQAIKPDGNLIHIKCFDLPTQEKMLVIDTSGIVWLGEKLAETCLSRNLKPHGGHAQTDME